ncbi:ubiquitin-conjugating enzyme/RWD-like protein, partial [Tanacetum coccineum]
GNDRTFYPFTNKALSDSRLGKVLVEDGDEVERGQTLNRKSRVGIFSMEDVLVDHDHSHQMEGLDNEEDVLKRKLCNEPAETIFLRVYENRMDLLRAVIIEPTGTPYHNGLFFSDVCFPSNYPDSPPNFEVFVVAHFRSRVGDIFTACNKDTGSFTFKNDLSSCICIKQLAAFIQIGPRGSVTLSIM